MIRAYYLSAGKNRIYDKYTTFYGGRSAKDYPVFPKAS